MASRFARTAGEYQMSRNSLIDSASCRRISPATERRRSDLIPANAGGLAFASVAAALVAAPLTSSAATASSTNLPGG